MTVSYGRYDDEYTIETTKEKRKCNRLCWNTLFMFGDYDPNLAGATKSAKFAIQRGEIWEDDDQTININHTLMAAVAKTSSMRASGHVVSDVHGVTPNGVMCSFLPYLKFFCHIFVVC